MLADIRYAFRGFRRAPLFAIVAVLSLAIGIGANSAIFSVVNALLLRPLPYPDPDRLAILWLRSPGINIPQDWPSPGEFIDVQTANHSLEEMSISQGGGGTLAGLDQPERVEFLRTSSSLFHLLGAKPLYGRLLMPEDDKPGKAPIAILSYSIWQKLFHSDPNVVGRSITINGAGGTGSGENKNQFTVAGILPRDFLLNDEIMPTVSSTRRMDIFLPLPFGADAVNRRGDENYNIMARLKPGVTMAQARADVAVIASHIREKDKRDRTFTIDVVPLMDQVVGDVRRALLVLLGSVALVLLIACANVANLLLSRATGRQKEVAVRTALGASWTRLVRQLLTESVLLSIAGGAAGLLIAEWSLYIIRTVNPGNIPRLDVIGIDGTVLAFTFAVSIITGIVFGLAPALRSVRLDLNTALKAGGRSSQGDGGFSLSRHRLRGLLVVSELALSLMLLIGAGLLIRSFTRLQSVSPGFNPDHVVSLRLGAGNHRFQSNDEANAFFRGLIEKVRAIPAVHSTGTVSSLPFTSSVGWGGINIEGYTPQPGEEIQVDQRAASSDYFHTMEIPLIQGRFFDDHDSEPKAPLVGIVDQKFADRFWPKQSALGKRVDGPKNWVTIVGVVGVVKEYGLDVDPRMVYYRPGAGGEYLVARTSLDASAVSQSIVRALREADPSRPLYDVRTMQDRMKDSLARQRFSTIMLGAFSVFALILAAVGVYGVMSYLVTQSRRDIGLRIALGASRNTILWLVVRQGMELAISGIVLGTIGAFALTRLMASLLFGVGARDVPTFSTVPLILGAIALIATYIPAYRATQVDPMMVLREE
ncbi:MAG TPA: ABC transporter permease [Bryobacteraceae bacterium]|jgi:predicted permease|nr:ABC transporter permease [Bryobacteraceae bacterium]